MKRKLIENYTIENKEKLYRIAFSYTKNKEDALDIVQESVLKALKSANTLKNPQYIKTWYYKILTRTAIDYIRKIANIFHLIQSIVLKQWENMTIMKI